MSMTEGRGFSGCESWRNQIRSHGVTTRLILKEAAHSLALQIVYFIDLSFQAEVRFAI